MFTRNPDAFPLNGIMVLSLSIKKQQDTQEADDELLDGVMYSLSKCPGYAMLDRSDTRLGGVDGKSVTVRFSKKGSSKYVRICASAFIVGKYLYVIMCGSDDSTFVHNIPAFAKALSSVQFAGH